MKTVKVSVDVEVYNMPEDFDISESGYLVLRVCGGDCEFWYYGLYSDEKTALTAANECGNGIVVYFSGKKEEDE